MKSLVVVLLLVAGGGGVAEGLTREYVLVQGSWYFAQSYCRQNYRDLATITTNEEKQRLLQLEKNRYVWVGLRKSYSTPWTWFNGEPFLSQNWNGELSDCPSSSSSSYYYYDCCLYTYNGNWISNYCGNGINSFCYRFLILVKEKKRWEEAEEFCRTNYTGLASVTSESSLSQVRLETAGTETESVWTGLRFMDGQWFWVNKEQLGSLVSMPSCPVDPYRCGALNTTTNSFQNQNCDEKLNFVCYLK